MRLVLRPLGDPSLQRLDLLWSEPADLRLGGRHDRVGIVRYDAGEQLAGVEVFRDDRPRAAVELGRGQIERVEPQASLAVGVVGAVACEAVFREDRPDVMVERQPGRGTGGRGSSSDRKPRACHRGAYKSEGTFRATHTPKSSRAPVRVTRVADSGRNARIADQCGRSAGPNDSISAARHQPLDFDARQDPSRGQAAFPEGKLCGHQALSLT